MNKIILSTTITLLSVTNGFRFATGANVQASCSGKGGAGVQSDIDSPSQKNILGDALQPCSFNPLTGYFRTGCCETGPQDSGVHTVCAVLTEDFLEYTKAQGNDLSTPRGGFPGLKAGDRWCLCAMRWHQAFKAGKAPGVLLAATNIKTLQMVPYEDLLKHAVGKGVKEGL
ncbi:hypothetical protein FGO68_gene6473 [Halteria grandinella]|uniref:DUF2237 domain-containing protein n=1 Tax=Halteria grandinella TaxID=5974 RepID=A0A8J8P138_HALGN|nr:hypothetical protein FGO68_gene6473 [Halteria grandinella]